MKRLCFFTVIAAFSLFGIHDAQAQNADTLLRKMDMLMSAPIDKEATVTITLIDKSGKESVREAQMKQKGKDKKLYRYTKPEKQAGIATLSLPDDVMWLYMPAFGTPTKISLLSKSQAFTGTDFSYEDMENRSYLQRYKPKLMSSAEAGINKLELTPISKKSKYSKIVLSQNSKNFYPVKMEYFDDRAQLFKVATYKYAKQGKYWYAEEVVMTDLKKSHSTKIRMSNMKFDQGLSDEEFSVKKLKP
jgi:outer membrane lipoprotein-sorting protein